MKYILIEDVCHINCNVFQIIYLTAERDQFIQPLALGKSHAEAAHQLLGRMAVLLLKPAYCFL